jgi:hypothetical protein
MPSSYTTCLNGRCGELQGILKFDALRTVIDARKLLARDGSLPVLVLGERDAYYHVHERRFAQAPSQFLALETLVLCPAFDPAFPSLTECLLGAACRHVHADVTGLPLIDVHVNYAWRTLEDVTYPRHEAGTTVQVAPPNSRQVTDTIETRFLLRTRALRVARGALNHCAHYYLSRQCNLGEECSFVHAVFVDPEAPPRRLRLAPTPMELGRVTRVLPRQQRGDEASPLRGSPSQRPVAPTSQLLAGSCSSDWLPRAASLLSSSSQGTTRIPRVSQLPTPSTAATAMVAHRAPLTLRSVAF